MARTPKRPSASTAAPPALPTSNGRTTLLLPIETNTLRIPEPLSAEHCWAPADLSHVAFETTDDLEVLQGVIEQDRAVRALELGLGIDGRSYNIYIAGASGTGKRTQLRNLLARISPQKPVPPDWVYVHNFKDPYAPVAISLKPGQGHTLKKMSDELLAKLFHEIPKAFHSKEHQQRLQRIMSTSASRESSSLEDLSERVSEVGFAVKNTRSGLVMVPVVNDQPLSKREVSALPDRDKKRIEKQREKLDPLISEFIQKARDIEQEAEKKLEDAQRNMGNQVSKRYIDAIRKKFPDGGEKMTTYLDGLQEHILANLSRFLSPEREEDEEDEKGAPSREQEGYMLEPEPFVEFSINVVVDNSETKGAPIVQETHPTFYRLFGKIERRVEQGIWFTDHRMIHAGAVAKANGGYLVLHAQDLFQFPGVWETLKSTLRNREVSVEDQGETMGLLPTSGLKPETIPIRLKLILIGSNTLYHMLYQYDDDFQKLFQVKSDFDDEIKRDPEVFGKYARFVATAVKNNRLLPADRSAVASVIEQSSRQVESQERLTLRFNEVANLMTEADFHARRESSSIVRKEHVELAIAERELRSSLIADKMYEELADGLILIDTQGTRAGVINGLAVYQIGDYQFGRPSRISARCYAGRGGIINVERQSRLSGSSHDKGILILAGLLGDLFATERPLGLTVSLAFEQSYGPIDGDSASSAEFYATLSALSNMPIKQGIAVTGSLNQMGEIQPIGGANFKIEGFFRLCQDRGLDGTQGVIIPAQNVRHLMLSRQVREAIRAKKFFLWPVRRVEQGIELLMGISAGVRQEDGSFPEHTLYRAVADRLAKLNQKIKPTPSEHS
jgi:lon-related putative ATP-dependent protease